MLTVKRTLIRLVCSLALSAGFLVTLSPIPASQAVGSDSAYNFVRVVVSGDGTQIYAANNNGGIWRSSDEGRTWTRTNAATKSWQTLAVSQNGNIIFATESSTQQMWKSTDSGTTWSVVSAAGTKNWRSISISSDATKLAGITDSTADLWQSNDGGDSWTSNSTIPKFIDNASNPTTGRFNGCAAPHVPVPSWFGLTMSGTGQNIAVTNGGHMCEYEGDRQVFTSDDFGVTWYQQTGCCRDVINYNSITSSRSETNWTIAMGGYQSGMGIGTWSSTSHSYSFVGGSMYANLADTYPINTFDWGKFALSSNGSKLIAAGRYNGWTAGQTGQNENLYSGTAGSRIEAVAHDSSTTGAWSDVSMSDSGQLQMAIRNSNGSVRVSRDGGATWSDIKLFELPLTPYLIVSGHSYTGFTAYVANYDNTFSWAVTTTAGAATINSSGQIVVTGLNAGEAATVVVTTSKAGLADGSSGMTERATKLNYSTPRASASGFTFGITAFNPALSWSVSADRGSVSIDASGIVTVTGLSSGEIGLVAVTMQDGAVRATVQVGGSALRNATKTGMYAVDGGNNPDNVAYLYQVDKRDANTFTTIVGSFQFGGGTLASIDQIVWSSNLGAFLAHTNNDPNVIYKFNPRDVSAGVIPVTTLTTLSDAGPSYWVSMTIDSRGYVWFNNYYSGLSVYDPSTNAIVASNSDRYRWMALGSTSDGKIWTNDQNRLSYITLSGSTISSLTPLASFQPSLSYTDATLSRDSTDQLWTTKIDWANSVTQFYSFTKSSLAALAPAETLRGAAPAMLSSFAFNGVSNFDAVTIPNAGNSSLTITSITTTSIRVNLTPVSGAASYTVKIYKADGVTLERPEITNFVSGSLIAGLTDDTQYFVSVTTIGDGITLLSSSESAAAGFKTAQIPSELIMKSPPKISQTESKVICTPAELIFIRHGKSTEAPALNSRSTSLQADGVTVLTSATIDTATVFSKENLVSGSTYSCSETAKQEEAQLSTTSIVFSEVYKAQQTLRAEKIVARQKYWSNIKISLNAKHEAIDELIRLHSDGRTSVQTGTSSLKIASARQTMSFIASDWHQARANLTIARATEEALALNSYRKTLELKGISLVL